MGVERDLKLSGWALLLALLLVFPGFTQAQSGFRWVVEPAYDNAGAAFEGVVPLLSDGRWGLMGSDGSWRVAPRYEALGRPMDGHVPVKVNGSWGIIDLDGREVIKPIYEDIGQWAERIPAKTSDGWMVLGKSGIEIAGPLPIDRLRGNEGHCIAGQVGDRAYIYDDREGYARGFDDPDISSQGSMRLYRPSAGVIGFSIGGKFGFVDCGWLRMVVEPEYQAVRRAVSDDKFTAFLKDGKWGLMSVTDNGARQIFAPEYAGMREYAEDRLPVKMQNGKWGYLDPHGELIVPATFDQAYSFSDGIAGVQVGDKRGFILPDGSFAADPQFEDFWRHARGIAPVRVDGKWGVITFNATAPDRERGFDPEILAARADKNQFPNVQFARPHRYFRQDYFNAVQVVLSSDGRLAATLLDESDGEKSNPFSEIVVWDLSTRLLLSRFVVPDLRTAVFLPGSTELAVGTSDGSISFRDTVSGNELGRIRPSIDQIVAMTLDGSESRMIATDGANTWIWQLSTGKEVAELPRGFDVLAPMKNAMGFYGATSDGTLLEVDATTGKIVAGDQIDVISGSKKIAIGSFGEFALAMDWGARPPSGEFPLTVKVSGDPKTAAELSDQGVFTLDFSDDGERLLYASPEGIRIFDPATMDVLVEMSAFSEMETTVEGVSRLPAIDTVSYLPGSREVLVVGTEGAPILTIDPEEQLITGAFGVLPEAGNIGVSAVAANGRLFIAPHEFSVVVFDLDTASIIKRIEGRDLPEIPEFVDFVSLSSDGWETVFFGAGGNDEIAIDVQSLAVRPRNANDDAVELIEVPDRHRAALGDLGLPDYRSKVSELADGKILFLGRFAGVHEFYGTQSGDRLARMALLDHDEWVIFTDMGFFDGTRRGIEALSSVDGLSAQPVAQALARYHRPDLVREILAGDPDGVARQEAERLQTLASAETHAPRPVANPTDASPDTGPQLPGLNLSLDAGPLEGDAEKPPSPNVPGLPGLSLTTEGTD